MKLTDLTPWKWNDRSLSTRRGVDPFAALQQEMNQLIESFFDDSPMRLVGRSGAALLSPKLDVSETEKELHVAVELPGMKEEDIEVEFTGDALRIRGEKKDERDEKQHNFHRIERSFGMFERVIPLPVEVDREKAQATFKNGVLTITVPKVVAAPPVQKIPVKPAT
jgi:HSP20 family protein